MKLFYHIFGVFVFCMFLLVIIGGAVIEDNNEQSDEKLTFKDFFQSPHFWLCTVITLIFSIGMGSFAYNWIK